MDSKIASLMIGHSLFPKERPVIGESVTRDKDSAVVPFLVRVKLLDLGFPVNWKLGHEDIMKVARRRRLMPFLLEEAADHYEQMAHGHYDLPQNEHWWILSETRLFEIYRYHGQRKYRAHDIGTISQKPMWKSSCVRERFLFKA